MKRLPVNPWIIFIIPVIVITLGLAVFFRQLSPLQVNIGLSVTSVLIGVYFIVISSQEKAKVTRWLFHGCGIVVTVFGIVQLVMAIKR